MSAVKHLRPWNVRPGDRITVEVFPFEQPETATYVNVHGLEVGQRTFTVAEVIPGRHLMTGERQWTLYAVEETFPRSLTRRLGTYYRDQRVTVTR